MPDFPETRDTLLIRVRRRDQDAWAEFSEIYRPAIYRIVRKRGWQDADAQDIAQNVLLKVSDALPRFDLQGPARFSTWLTTVCHNALVDELRRRSRIQFDDLVNAQWDQTGEPLSDEELGREHRRQVFRWAAHRASQEFTATTWQAFWMTAVDGMKPAGVAAELEISVGAVYTARSRVMQALQKLVQECDDAEL